MIDRIFLRMQLTYGSQWTRMWENAPIADVKSLWTHELSAYMNETRAPDVAWALENLPEMPPNAVQFRKLCRHAPAQEAPRLPEPKVNPERLKAELEKLVDLKASVKASPVATGDGREWARRILGRFELGEKINACTLRFAREAIASKGSV